jgi:hypothetical protein
MKNPQDELIWQGRIHIGDEPGVYGDASYCGLCAELPFTIRPFDEASDQEDISLLLEAEDVNVFAGYPGHSMSVIGYEPDPLSGPYKWKQVTLLMAVLTGNTLQINLPGLQSHKYISIQLRVDTTVTAGLYNDFVWIRLSLKSTTHYAMLGFEV